MRAALSRQFDVTESGNFPEKIPTADSENSLQDHAVLPVTFLPGCKSEFLFCATSPGPLTGYSSRPPEEFEEQPI